jgi:hypothetical protein
MQKTNSQTQHHEKVSSSNMQLKLFNNVQFIYELALAKLELEALVLTT